MNSIYKNIYNLKKNIKWQNLINNKNLIIGKAILKPNNKIINNKIINSEYFYVLNGEAEIKIDNKNILLKKDNFIEIPKNSSFYTINKNNKDFEFIYMFPNNSFKK